ncbi:MAG TPA: transporter, partial [Pirellulaceae bacterium]
METGIGIVDAIIVGVYLLAMVGVGIWVTRGQESADAYFLGDRDLPWWAILGSIVATETSTVTFLSIPGSSAAKQGDFRFLQLACGYVLGRLIVARWLLPWYFRGRMSTAFEVLQTRFGATTKTTVSLIFLVARNLADGLRLFLAALVLEQLTGWDLVVCMCVLGMTTIVYTVLGGLRSVVWNDCVQLVIYLIGAIIALAVIVRQRPGGWDQLWSFGHAQQKVRVWHADLDLSLPYTIWSGIVGGMV